MEKLQSFLQKWGLLIMIIMLVLTKISTCNIGNHVERLEKKIVSLEKEINNNDSILIIKNHLEMELYNLKGERSTLHNMNEIVLKNIRPAEKISEIDKSIDELNQKLRNFK